MPLSSARLSLGFSCVGHAYVHLFTALYLTAVLFMEDEFGLPYGELITLWTVGAFLFGFAQDHFGSVPSLAVALLVWVSAVGITFFADDAADLWLAGNLMGLAMGSTQAGGRALIGRLTPVARSAEFFGLWGFASRAAAIMGPLSYGVVNRVTDGDHRMALLSTLMFFLLGLLLLTTVDEQRGSRARDTNP